MEKTIEQLQEEIRSLNYEIRSLNEKLKEKEKEQKVSNQKTIGFMYCFISQFKIIESDSFTHRHKSFTSKSAIANAEFYINELIEENISDNLLPF